MFIFYVVTPHRADDDPLMEAEDHPSARRCYSRRGDYDGTLQLTVQSTTSGLLPLAGAMTTGGNEHTTWLFRLLPLAGAMTTADTAIGVGAEDPVATPRKGR